MNCPFCGSAETRVVDSRPAEQGRAIRRRRECETCGDRFTTYERTESLLMVLKRSGRTEPFRTDKLRRGLENALADRPVGTGTLDELVDTIETELRAVGTVVSSDEIGRQVLDRLRDLDEVAYLRFASVYKEFEGAQDFEREMASLDVQESDSS
ncbi:MAG: transcriptional repressor NrdR [Acidimicrobiia bacterium]|nr:transcriptional repressor NrdR [Acidimicrobiia bacterium]